MQQKQLPATPSLEHLKSQAKQLLKAHKEGSLAPFQRIRSFFPKLSDATDVEIQSATFSLQDAQLVIAREYGFASWTRLKEEVLHRERDTASVPTKDVLFQILRTPDLTQADIQRVEDLLTADPSLVSVREENGRIPIEALASRSLINFGKERWYRPIRQLYDLFREHGAATNVVAAVLMDDREYVETSIHNNLEVLKQRFDISRKWRGINLLAIAAGCARAELAKILILVAIGTWYGVRGAPEALDECLEIVVALLDAGADVHRRYRVDIDGEVLELTPLTYTQKLASLFPDKPFDRIIEVLRAADAI